MEKKQAEEAAAKEAVDTEKSTPSADKNADDVNIAKEAEAASEDTQISLEEAIKEADQDD